MNEITTIPVAPRVLGEIGGIPMTTAFISSLVVTVMMLAFVFYVYRKRSIVPGRAQLVGEMLINFFYSQLTEAYGSKERAKKYLPLIVSLFMFIVIANQFSVIPLIQSFTEGDANLFRSPTSHFSLTLSFSIVVFLISNLIAISISPLQYVGNFIRIGKLLEVRSFGDLANALLDIFLGVLDIIGELAKVISLSARLFGNIFAGEVMVAVITGLSTFTFGFLVPIPFYALSLLAGLVQALVFAILSLSFISGMHTTVEAAKAESEHKRMRKTPTNKESTLA
jgi:F-type H+-transporting ATPase subunit a